jgi:hypothetical protein
MRHNRLATLLAIGITALLATTTTLIVGRLYARGARSARNVDYGRSTVTPVQSAPHWGRALLDEDSPRRLDALEREIEGLRKAYRAVAPQAEAAQSSAQATAHVRTPQETIAMLQQQHSEERADPSWSPSANGHLERGLRAIGQRAGFSVRDADCRERVCRATVTWDDYQSARKTGHELAEGSFPGLNCVRTIYLPEPPDPTGYYTANFYLDCAKQRAGEAEVPPASD